MRYKVCMIDGLTAALDLGLHCICKGLGGRHCR